MSRRPTVETTLDLHNKDVSAPSVVKRRLDVPKPFLGRFRHIEDADVMTPRNLSNKLLDNWLVRPRLRKSPHVEQVGSGKALHLWELGTQVLRQPVNHFGPPAFLILTRKNLPSDAQ